MEKLVNFNDWEHYRFQCGCMSPGCCLDLEVLTEDDKIDPIIMISINQHTRVAWYKRIVLAFKYLFRGEEICLGEIVLRKEDEKELTGLLNRGQISK